MSPQHRVEPAKLLRGLSDLDVVCQITKQTKPTPENTDTRDKTAFYRPQQRNISPELTEPLGVFIKHLSNVNRGCILLVIVLEIFIFLLRSQLWSAQVRHLGAKVSLKPIHISMNTSLKAYL